MDFSSAFLTGFDKVAKKNKGFPGESLSKDPTLARAVHAPGTKRVTTAQRKNLAEQLKKKREIHPLLGRLSYTATRVAHGKRPDPGLRDKVKGAVTEQIKKEVAKKSRLRGLPGFAKARVRSMAKHPKELEKALDKPLQMLTKDKYGTPALKKLKSKPKRKLTTAGERHFIHGDPVKRGEKMFKGVKGKGGKGKGGKGMSANARAAAFGLGGIGAAGLTAGGYALYKHIQKKRAEKAAEEQAY